MWTWITIAGGAARTLAVEPGDRVRAEGRFVQMDGADWLDLAQVVMLAVGRRGPWRSDRSVRLIGVDAAAIPTTGDADPSLSPSQVAVVGPWQGDTITVEQQSPVPRPAREQHEPLFALTAPAGGWDAADQSQEVQGLEQLRASGQIVRDGWIRMDGGALVLRVAAGDVDAVEQALAPQLPRRLCVVRSRYTAAQLREVEEMFWAHHAEWSFEAWSYQSLDAQCQPYAEATLTRVSTGLATWAATLPDGLLRLCPAMIPA